MAAVDDRVVLDNAVVDNWVVSMVAAVDAFVVVLALVGIVVGLEAPRLVSFTVEKSVMVVLGLSVMVVAADTVSVFPVVVVAGADDLTMVTVVGVDGPVVEVMVGVGNLAVLVDLEGP